MHKDLLNKLRVHVNVLNLLWHDVFALTQLKDVLLAIDDLQCSIAKPLTDVACVMPSEGVNRLSSSLWIAEISKDLMKNYLKPTEIDENSPLKHARSFNAHLALLIGCIILHLRNINKLRESFQLKLKRK